jgi:hypothetical protein
VGGMILSYRMNNDPPHRPIKTSCPVEFWRAVCLPLPVVSHARRMNDILQTAQLPPKYVLGTKRSGAHNGN